MVPGAPGATGDFFVPTSSNGGPNGLLLSAGLVVILAGLAGAGFFGRRAILARRTN